jgi:hypothetical protein
MSDYVFLFESEKSLLLSPTWAEPHKSDGCTWFNAPLEIDGDVVPGLVLHGEATISEPDRHVSLELRLEKTPGRRKTPISRLDWRSIDGHSNKRFCADRRWSGVRVDDTHYHDFWLNFSETDGRLREALPCARNIEEDLNDFNEVLVFVGKSFGINNIEIVPRPDWRYDMFTGLGA